MPDLVQYKGIFRVPSSAREESEGEDGTVQLFKMGDGRGRWAPGMPFRHPPYSTCKLFAQRIGAASKRDLPAQDPRSLGLRLRLRLRRSPIASFSTEHLQCLLVSIIAPCCNFCQLQNPNNLVLDTLAPKV
jgi:hypothetical protein